jgi:transcriptional regulator with XRE-family HTH domain
VNSVAAERFGKNLTQLRSRADLSQEEPGFLASLHRTEVGMLERGIRLARIDTLIKLAAALEVDTGDLLDGIAWHSGGPPTGSFSTREEQP